MVWKVELSAQARKFVAKLDRPTALRIDDFFENRLPNLEDPRSIGERLKGDELGSFWKYRIGDWRIIASIENTAIRIAVINIGHRRDVYR